MKFNNKKKLAIATFSVFMLLIFGTQSISIYLTTTSEQYAREINLAGRQRMLSQKIAKEVLSVDSVSLVQVIQDAARWQQAHIGLQSGDHRLGTEGVSSASIARQLSAITPHVEAIVQAVDAFATRQITRQELRTTVRIHEEIFLEEMDRIVYALESYADEQNHYFEMVEVVMAAVSITILVLGFFLIFRPMYRRITLQEERIKENVEAIKLINRDLEEKMKELAQSNNELRTTEEELRAASEEQLEVTQRLEEKILLTDQYVMQLSVAQETAELGYWSYDMKSNVVWSEQMYKIFGLPIEDNQAGPNIESYRAAIHPDDRELSSQKAEEAIQRGKVRYQLRIVRAGKTRFIDTIIKRHTDATGQTSIFGVARDVTEEVESRQALISAKETAEAVESELRRTKTVLEQTSTMARVGGWELDCLTKEVYWTQITREIHEADQDFVPDLDSGINFYREGHDREVIQRVVTQAMETGEPWDEEVRIVTARGNERWVRSIGRAELDGQRCIRLYGTFQDITHQTEAREELEYSKEMAEQAVRIKQEFLANMSHEIRTPMNAILGFTRLLLRGEQSPEQMEYLQSIYGSANTLLVVINDILDFSKIEAGKLTIDQVHFRMGRLLHAQSTLFSMKVQESDLMLIFETDPRMPRALLGDPTRISQILNNLISNAIKFTQKGSVRVITDVAAQAPEGYQLTIKVQDTGIGIAPDKLNSIFQSFEQETGDTTRLYGGTGLGLTIVEKLVTLMHGKISVESQPDVGSTFTVTLPLGQGNEALIPSENEPTETLPLDRLAGKRILLTEDNRNNQMLARKCLSEVDCEVDLAVNGKEAVRMVQEQKYDVVLMDIRMPIMNGIEATEIIRALPPPYVQAPIIAMTAHVLKEEENQYRSVGMDEYVSKPFNPSELYRKLINVIEGRTWNTQPTADVASSESDKELPSSASKTTVVNMPVTTSLLDQPRGSEAPRDTPVIPLVSLNPDMLAGLPPFDQVAYTRLEEFASNDNAFVKEMLEVFLEDAPEYLRQLEVAMYEQNWEAFKDIAHTLKSNTMLLGMDHMASLIVTIEDMDVDNVQEEVLEKFHAYIQKNCEGAIIEVKKELT